MAWFTRQKLNECVHIEGVDLSIDIIVLALYGSRQYREADFEIHSVRGVERIHLGHGKFYSLDEQIKMCVCHNGKERSPSAGVEVHYWVPLQYSITKQKMP